MIHANTYTLLPAQRYTLISGMLLVEIIDTHDNNEAVMTFKQNDPDIYGTGIIFIKNEFNREFESYTETVLDYCNYKYKLLYA